MLNIIPFNRPNCCKNLWRSIEHRFLSLIPNKINYEQRFFLTAQYRQGMPVLVSIPLRLTSTRGLTACLFSNCYEEIIKSANQLLDRLRRSRELENRLLQFAQQLFLGYLQAEFGLVLSPSESEQ